MFVCRNCRTGFVLDLRETGYVYLSEINVNTIFLLDFEKLRKAKKTNV